MSIWFAPLTLEQAQRFFNGHRDLTEHLGMRLTEVGPDFLRATMPVDERTQQPFGLLHGGASVSLAESLGSTAANLCIDGSRCFAVGQEINANHLRPVRSGFVTATARPVHLGHRSHVWDIRIEDDKGRLSCVSRLTMSVIDAPGQGSAALLAARDR
jgi:1,4-dihydroxy-2-naphthoyl-CoA hydrolase